MLVPKFANNESDVSFVVDLVCPWLKVLLVLFSLPIYTFVIIVFAFVVFLISFFPFHFNFASSLFVRCKVYLDHTWFNLLPVFITINSSLTFMYYSGRTTNGRKSASWKRSSVFSNS